METEQVEGERFRVDGYAIYGDRDDRVKAVMRVAQFRLREKVEAIMKSVEDKPDPGREDARKRAEFFDALSKVAAMTPEEQVNMQISCLTQGLLDCAMRVSSDPELEDDKKKERSRGRRVPAVPLDARRSFRSAEIHHQAELANATARLMGAIAPIGGATVRHEFAYEHLHRHVTEENQQPAAPPPQQQQEVTAEEEGPDLVEEVFNELKITAIDDMSHLPPRKWE